MNSLANLTLVGKEFNAGIGNQVYAEKRSLYESNSNVILTRKLSKSYLDWREEDIEARVQELADLALACWPWENVIQAKVRWRITGASDWRHEKKHRDMLLNVISRLLDEDFERNSERLLGNRVRKDIFRFGESPHHSGSFRQIPGHNDFEVNTHFSSRDIRKLCLEMAKRCDVQIEIEIPERVNEGQQVWERVDLKHHHVSRTSQATPRWRISQGVWQEEKSYAATLLNVIAGLLDMDPERNSKRLLGDRTGRDLFRSGMEPTGTSARFRSIPRYDGYVVNLNLNGKTIFKLCREMGERCGVVVAVKIQDRQNESQEDIEDVIQIGPERATPRWRINQGDWQQERNYRAVLLSLVAELLNRDFQENSWRLSGGSITRDILPSHYSPNDPTRFRKIPGYHQYMINVDLTRVNIIRQCKELGSRCGVFVEVE